jgi:hypothetical protein
MIFLNSNFSSDFQALRKLANHIPANTAHTRSVVINRQK